MRQVETLTENNPTTVIDEDRDASIIPTCANLESQCFTTSDLIRSHEEQIIQTLHSAALGHRKELCLLTKFRTVESNSRGHNLIATRREVETRQVNPLLAADLIIHLEDGDRGKLRLIARKICLSENDTLLATDYGIQSFILVIIKEPILRDRESRTQSNGLIRSHGQVYSG